MKHTGLLAAAQIWNRLFQLNGLDPNRIWQEVGARPVLPDDPNARAPLHHLDAAVVLAASRIADPGWGLTMAQCWHPGNLGVLGHAWLASSTLRTGLTRLTRYWRIVTTRAEIWIDDTPRGLRFSYALPPAHPLVESVFPDSVLSLVLEMCRVNSGERILPLQVSLRRSRPQNPAPWIDFFGCAVAFDAVENSLTFATADVDRVLPTANRPLAGVFDSMLTEQLARLSRDDVVSRCKAEFLEQLSSGEPSADDIAQRLHMSSRTLQRKLAEADTTYLKLVDDTRRDMALRYIGDRGKSVSDITFLLGFSSQSAFSRAFKRWTGISPTEYRQQPVPAA